MSAATLESNETATEVKASAGPQSAIHWFEIPCADLERAATFYEALLDVKLKRAMIGEPMAVFPYANGGTGGMLVQRRRQKPGPDGVVVYLNCNGKLDTVLGRVASGGGLILLPKTEIPGGFGWSACIRDTEGNHVGLHSL